MSVPTRTNATLVNTPVRFDGVPNCGRRTIDPNECGYAEDNKAAPREAPRKDGFIAAPRTDG
ncbi:hypothetical protein BRC80_03905 [Halobacteriales archaeon QH_9_66_26]|nr:MAG: hypothetical protein BRC80_03905 [Halobacteriales archaeon QH_9_66_26]